MQNQQTLVKDAINHFHYLSRGLIGIKVDDNIPGIHGSVIALLYQSGKLRTFVATNMRELVELLEIAEKEIHPPYPKEAWQFHH